MKKLFTIVFSAQLTVNTIVIFCILLVKQIKFLQVMFGISLIFQVVGVLVIAMLASSKSPFIQVENRKYIVMSDKDMPKGGK